MRKKLILYVAMASLLCWASVGVWSVKTSGLAASASENTGTGTGSGDKDDSSASENTNPDDGNGGAQTPDDGNGGAQTPDDGNGGAQTPDDGNGGAQTPDNGNGGNAQTPDNGNGGNAQTPDNGNEETTSSGGSNKKAGGSSNAPAQTTTTSSMGLPTSVSDAVDAALAQGTGSTVVVDTDKVVTSADLRKVAAAGGKLTVFCGPGISWHFAGITNPDAELNPNVDIGANIPEITNRLNGVPGIAIRFMHNGALPGTAYVGLQVPFADGTTLYFYYFNRSTGLFEFQQTTTVAQGGYAVVALTHCSDYVLTTAPMTSGVANGPVPTTKNAGRLDGTPHTGI